MATVEECRKALEKVASWLSGLSPEVRQKHFVDRTISCRVTDLGIEFRTRLGPDGPGPIAEARPDDPPAQVAFSAASDDLVALAEQRLHIARAIATGRLKVHASVFDLLRLRSAF